MESSATKAERLALVFAWRLEMLLNLGYPAPEAEALAADANVELSEAARLLVLGCPPETAVRILL